MTILITGATGLVGRALAQSLLDQGADVRVVTRRPHRVLEAFNSSRLSAFEWHPRTEPLLPEALEGNRRERGDAQDHREIDEEVVRRMHAEGPGFL